MADMRMVITAGGHRYDVNMGSFTAMDARLFRDEFGVPLTMAFQQPDLDLVAGVLWLHRRKSNGRLTYADVAATMSYDEWLDSMSGDEDDDDDAEESESGPET